MKKYSMKKIDTKSKSLRNKILLWNEENKEVVNSYNKRIKKNGLFSDGLRSF